MKTNQNRTTYIIFRIIGVFAAVILIAGIAFSAYRFGQQRGMLAAAESMVVSDDIEKIPWASPFFHWHGVSLLGNLAMICVAIFLLRMVIGLILGPGPRFRGRPHFHRCYHRWCAAYPWEPGWPSKDEKTDSKTEEAAPES
jgi:hypothetical protein